MIGLFHKKWIVFDVITYFKSFWEKNESRNWRDHVFQKNLKNINCDWRDHEFQKFSEKYPSVIDVITFFRWRIKNFQFVISVIDVIGVIGVIDVIMRLVWLGWLAWLKWLAWFGWFGWLGDCVIDVIGVIDVISLLFCQKFSLNHRVHVIAFLEQFVMSVLWLACWGVFYVQI